MKVCVRVQSLRKRSAEICKNIGSYVFCSLCALPKSVICLSSHPQGGLSLRLDCFYESEKGSFSLAINLFVLHGGFNFVRFPRNHTLLMAVYNIQHEKHVLIREIHMQSDLRATSISCEKTNMYKVMLQDTTESEWRKESFIVCPTLPPVLFSVFFPQGGSRASLFLLSTISLQTLWALAHPQRSVTAWVMVMSTPLIIVS